MSRVEYLTFENAGHHFESTSAPTECPLCRRAIDPRPHVGVQTTQASTGPVEKCYQCPHRECRGLFIAYFETYKPTPTASARWRLVNLRPANRAPVHFAPEVEAASPTFVLIYNQAAHAEAVGLDEVAGMAYRKALEFLIKDYLIGERPDDKDGIESTQLGATINNYVTDHNIKACATRAVWLGNDETHYRRKWEDHDIGDLKRLVQLTVNWIHNSLLTKKYQQEMDTRR